MTAAARAKVFAFIALGTVIASIAGVLFSPVSAAVIQNTVTGTVNGVALDLSTATISMQVGSSGIATGAVAEISPNVVPWNTAGALFSHDTRITLSAGDSGVDRVVITAPAGYTALAATAVSVAGAPLSAACPSPAAGQYCATAAGQSLTVTLGSKVTVDQTNLRVQFSANTPSATGAASFAVTVYDVALGAGLAAINGNADGDAADANSQQVTVINTVNVQASTVSVNPDIVIADGTAQSVITVAMRDSAGQPVPNIAVALSSDRGAFDSFVQPVGLTSATGIAVGRISSGTVGVATVTARDVTDGYDVLMQPKVHFTQGQVLKLFKTANKKEVVVGDLVTYQVQVKNTTNKDVALVTLEDRIPPNFKFRKGSLHVNGAAVSDPGGNRVLRINLGTVPALVDANANGEADAGEAGYVLVSYQLIVGSGAAPGDYLNTAYAIDVCDRCRISNEAQAEVKVALDPLFDLGTILGKVFEDKNGDGKQDLDENGIAGAMVVLDNGSYVLTDEYGRYHFPAVTPGHRLLKINLHNLAMGAAATTDEAQVVSVTQGLLVKANFGVTYRHEIESIGREAVKGVALESAGKDKPIAVRGSVELMTALINGQKAALPTGDIQLGVDALEDTLEIKGGRLVRPAEFKIRIELADQVARWRLEIQDTEGNPLRVLQGEGALADVVPWDGRNGEGQMLHGGQVYQYQMRVEYLDGSRSTTPRRLFGVNRAEVLSVNMTGGAFVTGSHQLSEQAKGLLMEVANTLREFPDEQVMVEGHADALGSAAVNLELSRRRAEEAARYLVEEQGVPAQQLVVQWYGKERPIASNKFELGRQLNRRVEIKGQFNEEHDTRLYDQYRVEPAVSINGEPVALDERGRFAAQIPSPDQDTLALGMTNRQGRSLETVIRIPRLQITAPAGRAQLIYGAQEPSYRVNRPPQSGWKAGDVIATYRLEGVTDPGNSVEIDGAAVAVDEQGAFASEVPLRLGSNRFSLLARNSEGYLRVADLRATLTDRDEAGQVLLLVKPIPKLSVKLPPRGEPLRSATLPVTGVTDFGNKVSVNGEAVEVHADGQFSVNLNLPAGGSTITVTVTDVEGYTGTIERDIAVAKERLFLLAFADGKVGQMQGSGHLQGAGMDKSSELYTEGRVAYYLKGMVAGKYLITSAFDSGTQRFGKLFSALDDQNTDRLLTNLDPNKLYPVYGDGSTLVHDAQSLGRFYLAIDADAFNVLVGNYPINLADTELARYQRTLYGVQGKYHSLSRSQNGKPDAEVVVFGAELRQAHIEDEIRATGGSLYYLSHDQIIEGSEQITLVVKDKNTGLVLNRVPQRQNIDYHVYYDQGRILFSVPVASVAQSGGLFNAALLAGHPVYVQMDYETRLESFQQTAYGTRLRQQVTGNLAVGGTVIHDESQTGAYDLQGVDLEMRLSRGSRVLAELAQSAGVASFIYGSEDGGLSYTQVSDGVFRQGSAWKLATEVDVGEWLDKPGMAVIGAYIRQQDNGFLSGGNGREQGSQKAGANLRLKVSDKDTLLARHDASDIQGTVPGSQVTSSNTAVQWQHDEARWGVSTEYHDQESTGATASPPTAAATLPLTSGRYLAGEYRYRFSDRLRAFVVQQLTVSGIDNNQTSVGGEYQLSDRIALQGRVTQGDRGQAAQAGASVAVGDARVYLQERQTEDSAGLGTSATVIGGETRVGRASTLYSEYQWERSGAADKQVSLLGARRQWQFNEGLSLRLWGERGAINSGIATTDRYALGSELGYADISGIKASTRNELRREWGAAERVQWLSSNHMEYKVNADYTLLGKYRVGRTRDLARGITEARFDERSLGFAYRPVQSDRLNLLARYTRLTDLRPSVLGQSVSPATETKVDILSAEWSYDITPRLEWVDKQALKRKQEQVNNGEAFTGHTLLSIHRLNYRLRAAWEIGLEYRSLRQREAADQRDGWLTEFMWAANKHLRVGLGYNFTDFSDNDFSDNSYSVQGWFVRMQGKY